LENIELLKKKKFNPTKVIAPLIVLVVIYVGLEIIVRAAGISKFVLPTPTAIVMATINNIAYVWPQFLITLRTIVVGFIIAVPLGLLLAAVFSQSRLIVQATTPLLILVIVTPMITLIPLLSLWLGFDPKIRILVVVLQATPIIALNTLVGFTNVEKEKLELMRSLGASRMQTFIKLIFPNAMPQIFTGVKLGAIFSTIGAISADIVAGNVGLGFRLMTYAGKAITEMVYGCIIIIALMSITFYYIISFIEGKVIVWRK
jgi:NitT/TauT family transport system permease protein